MVRAGGRVAPVGGYAGGRCVADRGAIQSDQGPKDDFRSDRSDAAARRGWKLFSASGPSLMRPRRPWRARQPSTGSGLAVRLGAQCGDAHHACLSAHQTTCRFGNASDSADSLGHRLPSECRSMEIQARPTSNPDSGLRQAFECCPSTSVGASPSPGRHTGVPRFSAERGRSPCRRSKSRRSGICLPSKPRFFWCQNYFACGPETRVGAFSRNLCVTRSGEPIWRVCR
jgi:hypothetical protein